MMGLETARTLDRSDPLGAFRGEFAIADDALVYLDGNSLGRLPKRAVAAVMTTIEAAWGVGLVRSWDLWLSLLRETGDRLAPLIGADVGDVLITDQTSVDLYKLADAALHAMQRPDIVTDTGNFPSDRYVLAAVADRAGGRLRTVPADASADSIAHALDEQVGLVSLSHVAYQSGAMLDMEAITAATHAGGALALWDLSHSAGATPIPLREAEVDLAVGCTYKYLNGGPGAPGFLFVRTELHDELIQPIQGWFGHRDMFGFLPTYEPAATITRFATGTPPVLSLVGARAGIDVSAAAGIDAIRAKSVAMASAFIELAETALQPRGFMLMTPRAAHRRGPHVALRHPEAWRITQDLRDRGVIVDFRAPDVIRYGFAPLYNRFEEIVVSIEQTAEVIDDGTFLGYPDVRRGVT